MESSLAWTPAREAQPDQMAQPRVWALVDDRPGNTTQSLGLAQALGWPCEVKELQFTHLARTIKKIWGPFAATDRALDHSRSARLEPPWPDLVLSSGWRPAQIAQWIKRQSHGRTRIVQLGRKGGHVAGLFDLVVSCSYFRLPPHPRRIEVVVPLTQISPERLAEAAERWSLAGRQAPHPHVVVLVGGVTKRHCWDADIARRFSEEVRAFALQLGGTVFMVTSRRTGTKTTAALRSPFNEEAQFHQWRPEQDRSLYWAYLALADVIIVTGESESMLAEAAATGKPLFIYPLPETPPGAKARRKDRIVRYAYPERFSQGSVSFLQKLVGKCCRGLIAGGLVRPRRDLQELHQALIRHGVARFFGDTFPPDSFSPLREIDRVTRRVRALLDQPISTD